MEKTLSFLFVPFGLWVILVVVPRYISCLTNPYTSFSSPFTCSFSRTESITMNGRTFYGATRYGNHNLWELSLTNKFNSQW